MTAAPWKLVSSVGVWLAVGLAVAPSAQQQVNRQGAIVASFNKNVQRYMDVRQKAVSGFQALKEDADPRTISDREVALGKAIQTARAGAHSGEIFTQDVARVFRDTIKADFRRRSVKARKVMLDELPHFRPAVNQVYPPEWPLQTFPPPLLGELPKLPPELEYRFVSDALILRDVKANVVVDFMLDVF